MPERIVTVHRFEQLWREPAATPRARAAAFVIECCSGTYVRSLIADLGDAYCLELRRTAIGPFEVHDAVAPPPAGRAVGAHPTPIAARTRRNRRRCGRRLRAREGHPPARGSSIASAGVAVGTFDGVHLGHREVIAGSDSVLTFDPHPVSVVAPQHTPKLLTTLERKAELIAALGVQELIVIPFDHDFAQRSAERVHRRSARRRAAARRRSRSGRTSASGTAQGDPRAAGRRRRASRQSCSRCWRSTARSSPPATSAVSCGRRGRTRPPACSASPFQLRGEVVHGDERGRELGFPTANLVPDEALVCPGHGVYACLARADSLKARAAAVSIGVRPTFQTGRGELIEAYRPRLRGGPLWQDAAPGVPRAPARRAALRQRRGARGADAPRRRTQTARAIVECLLACYAPRPCR